jgi:hypothetical protein
VFVVYAGTSGGNDSAGIPEPKQDLMLRSMKPQQWINTSIAFHFHVINFPPKSDKKSPIEAPAAFQQTKMKLIKAYQIIAFTLSLPIGSAANAIVRELFDGSCESDWDCLNVGDCCSQYGYCGTGEMYCSVVEEVEVSCTGDSSVLRAR